MEKQNEDSITDKLANIINGIKQRGENSEIVIHSKENLEFDVEEEWSESESETEGSFDRSNLEEITEAKYKENPQWKTLNGIFNISERKECSVQLDEGKECRFCGTLSNLDLSLYEIHHFICKNCLQQRKETHNYRLISQTNALKKHGLTLKDLKDYDEGNSITTIEDKQANGEQKIEEFNNSKQIQKNSTHESKQCECRHQLAVKILPNPHGYENSMKLYYLFQILEISVLKYGSIERAHEIVEQKQEEKFAKTFGMFDRHTKSRSTPRTKESPTSATAIDGGCAKLQVEKKRNISSKQGSHQGARKKRYGTLAKRHCREHTFSETIEQNGHFIRRCELCDLIEEWEEI